LNKKIFYLLILSAFLLMSFLFIRLYFHQGLEDRSMILGFPYLGEKELSRYRLIFSYNKWPLQCGVNGTLNDTYFDELFIQYYCMFIQDTISLPVEYLNESKHLEYFAISSTEPLPRSPIKVHLVRRWVLDINFTLPEDITAGFFKKPQPEFISAPISNPYFFSIRFGLPLCFSFNASERLLIVLEAYVVINGKRFSGIQYIFTGSSYKKCYDPFTPLFISLSEDKIEMYRELYDILTRLQPGEVLKLEYIIELYALKEQAENATGYIELVLAYPYIEVQYPRATGPGTLTHKHQMSHRTEWSRL